MAHGILVVLILAYVGWRVYRWLRRNLGRQKFLIRRLAWGGAFLAAGTIFLAGRAFGHAQLMYGWVGGLVPGSILGVWGLRLTRFEQTAEGRFYTPHVGIGSGLAVIFVARLAYRALALKSRISFYHFPTPAVGQSALTYFTFELLAGYYLAYGFGLWWRFRARPAEIAADPAA